MFFVCCLFVCIVQVVDVELWCLTIRTYSSYLIYWRFMLAHDKLLLRTHMWVLGKDYKKAIGPQVIVWIKDFSWIMNYSSMVLLYMVWIISKISIIERSHEYMNLNWKWRRKRLQRLKRDKIKLFFAVSSTSVVV